VPHLPCGRRPCGYGDTEESDSTQKTGLPCKTSWQDYHRQTVGTLNGKDEFGTTDPPGDQENHPQTGAGGHHARPNHHGLSNDEGPREGDDPHIPPGQHDPHGQGCDGQHGQEQREGDKGVARQDQALRWWFGLRSHKRVEHFGELSQLLLDRHIGGFLLGDVVMASFEGVYEVGETSTISHEGRKVFWEGRDKAEVMGKKEWLWIPLVEAVFRVN